MTGSKLNTTREKIRSNPELSQKTLNEFRIFNVESNGENSKPSKLVFSLIAIIKRESNDESSSVKRSPSVYPNLNFFHLDMNIKVPDPFPRYRSPTKTPRLQGNKIKMKLQNENKPVQKEASKRSSEKKLQNENKPVGFPI